MLFQRGETRIAKEEGSTATAEGRLIAELKRQAEAQLEAKNREIDSIQGRLADIERQRQELQSGMDAKVKAREDELRLAVSKSGLPAPPIDNVRRRGGVLPQQTEIVERVLLGTAARNREGVLA